MNPNISTHVSYSEATLSNTAIRKGIDNTPSPEQLEAMKYVANELFEPLRNHFKAPIKISSFFRCHELNIAVGGAVDKNGNSISQHCKGEAMDLVATTGFTNNDIFDFFVDNIAKLDVDQVIAEYPVNGIASWIHVSKKKKGVNRRQILTIK